MWIHSNAFPPILHLRSSQMHGECYSLRLARRIMTVPSRRWRYTVGAFVGNVSKGAVMKFGSPLPNLCREKHDAGTEIKNESTGFIKFTYLVCVSHSRSGPGSS